MNDVEYFSKFIAPIGIVISAVSEFLLNIFWIFLKVLINDQEKRNQWEII